MLRLAALLAGVAAAFAAAPDKCPAGYTGFQGRCFKYNANPLTWVRLQRAPKTSQCDRQMQRNHFTVRRPLLKPNVS